MKIKKIVVLDSDGFQQGKVEGDTAYFYEDDYYLDDDGVWRTSSGNNEVHDLDTIKQSVKSWIEEFILDLEREGYEVDEDYVIIDNKFDER